MGWLPDPVSFVKYTAAGVVLSVGTVGGLLYAYQTNLIYPANIPSGSRTQVPTPDEFGMQYEDVQLVAPDGVRIKAYLMVQPENAEFWPTVILLHANAGNVGHRLPIAKVFYKKMNCNVLALSYRGYGLSEGSPNEKGIRMDAQTALDHVLSHPRLEKTNIFLYGQSIGGAVAIDLAFRNAKRITGLIVENTFLSLPKLVPSIIPFTAPFIFLLHQIWPSEEHITALPKDLPVLFLSGEMDELVPPRHMEILYQYCASEKKQWRAFAKGTHNDTCIQPLYFSVIHTFIESHTQNGNSSSQSEVQRSDEKAADGATDEKSTSLKSSPTLTRQSESDGGESFELIEKEKDDLDAGVEQGGVAKGMGPDDVIEEKLDSKLKHLNQKL